MACCKVVGMSLFALTTSNATHIIQLCKGQGTVAMYIRMFRFIVNQPSANIFWGADNYLFSINYFNAIVIFYDMSVVCMESQEVNYEVRQKM